MTAFYKKKREGATAPFLFFTVGQEYTVGIGGENLRVSRCDPDKIVKIAEIISHNLEKNKGFS